MAIDTGAARSPLSRSLTIGYLAVGLIMQPVPAFAMSQPAGAVESAGAAPALGSPPAPARASEVWAGCGVFTGDDKVVRTFPIRGAQAGEEFMRGGTVTLRCGDETYGYRHILKNHQADWETTAALAGENWRDLADFAIATALNDPDQVTYRTKNQAFCYKRVIYYGRKSNREVYQTTNAVVVVSANRNIITAYPTSAGC
jgi:hypothetical protein